MDAAAVILAIVAAGGLGAWWLALRRGWRHAARDQTPTERRVVVVGIVCLMVLPVGLAVAGASDRTALITIAIAIAAVVPGLIVVGARDHRRREERISARRRD